MPTLHLNPRGWLWWAEQIIGRPLDRIERSRVWTAVMAGGDVPGLAYWLMRGEWRT